MTELVIGAHAKFDRKPQRKVGQENLTMAMCGNLR